MLNTWWESASVPNELTQAEVASIYKKGNTELQDNYRPISLLPVAYKVFAHILKKRIEAGVEK